MLDRRGTLFFVLFDFWQSLGIKAVWEAICEAATLFEPS